MRLWEWARGSPASEERSLTNCESNSLGQVHNSVPAAPLLPQIKEGRDFIPVPPEPNEPPQSGVGSSTIPTPTSTACLEIVKAFVNGAARGCTGTLSLCSSLG